MLENRAKAGLKTPDRILDVAEELTQRRGFNAFSYADIASRLGITKASLHYHFPTKNDLGRALIERYTSRFLEALALIEQRAPNASERLRAYSEIYASVMEGGSFCLCGMLAAEYDTLPAAMKTAVTAFFDENVVWIARVLAAGRGDNSGDHGRNIEAARTIVSGMEGAMLVARPYGDPQKFKTTAALLIDSILAERDL